LSHPTPPPASKPAQATSVRDPLAACVHCGFCLDVCPTYQLTGDENNSPRGRLRLWREEAEGRIGPDPWTDFYTQECVGCLACEPACPANVPYGLALEQVRHRHVTEGRDKPDWRLRIADWLARHPRWFNTTMLPARVLRRLNLLRHRNLFPGAPPLVESTARYAERLMADRRPTGPRVALLSGCLMEAVFRELNFATVRVLIENNVQVFVPASQGCCGAFQEHLGLAGVERLRAQNRQAFGGDDFDSVVTNSAGCGLALSKTLAGDKPVRDVIDFLNDLGPVTRERSAAAVAKTRLYVDLPCHLIHGQRVDRVPERALTATGYRWELAPLARECCGSGGVYHLRKPENAREILAKKSAFLNEAEGDPVWLVTTNHVCMMQWNSARAAGLVRRPYQVRHLIQLLDPAGK